MSDRQVRPVVAYKCYPRIHTDALRADQDQERARQQEEWLARFRCRANVARAREILGVSATA
jgi:hypothetical protein